MKNERPRRRALPGRVLLQRATAAEARDWYGVFEVDDETDEWCVRTAYFQLWRGLPAKDAVGRLAEAAETLRRSLPEAFATLWYPDERRRYDERRGLGQTYRPAASRSAISDPRAEAELERLLSAPSAAIAGQADKVAKVLSDRGRVHDRRGNHDKSARYHGRAAQLDPKTVIYQVRYGFALFNDPRLEDDERRQRVKSIFDSAAAHAPYSPEARFALACYWRDVGHAEYCQSELEATLRAQPEHRRAAAALTQLKRAASAEPEPRRLPFGLDRVFGRARG